MHVQDDNHAYLVFGVIVYVRENEHDAFAWCSTNINSGAAKCNATEQTCAVSNLMLVYYKYDSTIIAINTDRFSCYV